MRITPHKGESLCCEFHRIPLKTINYNDMKTQLIRFKMMAGIWFIAATLSLSSCYSYRVTTEAGPGTEASKPVTAHAFFWGLVQKPSEIHTPVCDSLGVNGMSEVTVKSNFGYSLITVATLGIWSPVKIQWKCSKPCKKTGKI
jgi:hypothetical protein